ncbi:hypothetical protein HZS_1961, partial [Henneguya salminicola]
MQYFRICMDKLSPYRDRYTKNSEEKFSNLLTEADNEIILNNCKNLAEITNSVDYANQESFSHLIKDVIELMFILTNHEIDSIRIVICKYIFKIIKDKGECSRWALYALTIVAHTTGQEYRQTVANAILKDFLNLTSKIEDMNLMSTICETSPELMKYFGSCFSDKQLMNIIDCCITNISNLISNENTVIRCVAVLIQHTCLHARNYSFAIFYTLTQIINHFDGMLIKIYLEWSQFLHSFKIVSALKILHGIFHAVCEIEYNECDQFFISLTSQFTENQFDEFMTFLNDINCDISKNKMYNGMLILTHTIKIIFISITHSEKHVIENSFTTLTQLLKIESNFVKKLLNEKSIFYQINKLVAKIQDQSYLEFCSVSILSPGSEKRSHLKNSSYSSNEIIFGASSSGSMSNFSFMTSQLPEVESSTLFAENFPPHMRTTPITLDEEDAVNKHTQLSVTLEITSANDFLRKQLNSLLSNNIPHIPIDLLISFSLSFIIMYEDEKPTYEDSFLASTQIAVLDFLGTIISYYPEKISLPLSYTGFEHNYCIQHIFNLLSLPHLDSFMISPIISLASHYDICAPVLPVSLSTTISQLLMDFSKFDLNTDIVILKSLLKFYSRTVNIILLQSQYFNRVIDFIHLALNISLSPNTALKFELVQFFSRINYRLLVFVHHDKCKNDRKLLMRRELFPDIYNTILRVVASNDTRLRNAAISTLLTTVFFIPYSIESQLEMFYRSFAQGYLCEPRNYIKNYLPRIPSYKCLQQSISQLVLTVVRTLSLLLTKDNMVKFFIKYHKIGYCHCLTEIGLEYSPLLIPTCWNIKQISEWKNNTDRPELYLFSILFEIISTNLSIASDIILHVSLLKLAIECLGGGLVKSDIEPRYIIVTSSMTAYQKHWETLFEHSTNILSIFTEILIDRNNIIEMKLKKRILSDADYFKIKSKIKFDNMIRFSNVENSETYKKMITKQINIIYDSHMYSLSKIETDKLMHFGVCLLHSIELLLMFSTYDYVSEDPEYFVLKNIRSRPVRFYQDNMQEKSLKNFSNFEPRGDVCIRNVPDIPIATSDRFDSPPLTIFSPFISTCFKYYYNHYSIAFQALALDIVELFVCMQVNYMSLDPDATFLKLTQTKFNSLLSNTDRISPYFAKRLFRFWSLCNNILSMHQLPLDEAWKTAMESTNISSLIVLVSNKISGNDTVSRSVISSFDSLINDIFIIKFEIHKTSIESRTNTEYDVIFEIIFEKCYNFILTYEIIENILIKFCKYCDESSTNILQHIYINLVKLIQSNKIPLENLEFFSVLDRIFNLFLFTTVDIIEELVSLVWNPRFMNSLVSDGLDSRSLSTSVLLLKWYFDFPNEINQIKYHDKINECLGILFLFKLDVLLNSFQINLILFTKLIKIFINSGLTCLFLVDSFLKIFQHFQSKIKSNLNSFILDSPNCVHDEACAFVQKQLPYLDIRKFIYLPTFIVSYFRFNCMLNSYCSFYQPTEIKTNILFLNKFLDFSIPLICLNVNASIFIVENPVILFKIIYELCDEDEAFNESFLRIREYFNCLSFKKIIVNLLHFVNNPNFNTYKFMKFFTQILKFLPEMLFMFFSHLYSITWLDFSENLPILMELDEFLLDLQQNNKNAFSKIEIYVTERFKRTYNKIAKNELRSSVNIVEYILNESFFNARYIDEISSVFPLLETMTHQKLSLYFESNKISSVFVSRVLISHYIPRLILSGNNDPLHYESIYLILSHAISLVSLYVHDLVSKIMNVLSKDSTIIDSQKIHSELLQFFTKNSCEYIQNVISCCTTLLFSRTILNFDNNFIKIEYQEIYRFSLFIASKILKHIKPLKKRYCPYAFITFIAIFPPVIFLRLFLAVCNFDIKYSPLLFLDCQFKSGLVLFVTSDSNFDYYLASCQLSYLAFNFGYYYLQYHESCSRINVQFQRTCSHFSYSFISFIYSVSRHVLFSSFVHLPKNCLPELINLTANDCSEDHIEIAYIPVRFLKKHHDIKEMIIRFIKLGKSKISSFLGWTSKQMYMECMMVLLNLITVNSTETSSCLTHKKARILMTVCKGITQLLSYTVALPFKGDPMFSVPTFFYKSFPHIIEIKDRTKNFINLDRDIPNTYENHLIFSFNFLFRNWNNLSIISRVLSLREGVLNNQTPNTFHLSQNSEFSFESFGKFQLIDEFTLNFSYLTDTNSSSDISRSPSVIDLTQSYSSLTNTGINALDNMPVIKPLLEFYLSSLNPSLKYINSIYRHKLMKSLFFLTNYITEGQDFNKILDVLLRLNSEEYQEDYIFLKYFLLLSSKCLSVISDHKICKIFLSNLDRALNHPYTCIQTSFYSAILNMRPYQFLLLGNLFTKMSLVFIDRLKNINKPNNTPYYEKTLLLYTSTYISIHDRLQDTSKKIMYEFTDSIFIQISDTISYDFDFSLSRIAWLCLYQLLLFYTIPTHFKKSISSALQKSRPTYAYIDIVNLYIIAYLSENDHTHKDLGEYFETTTLLIKKINIFDIGLATHLSEAFYHMVINMVEIEDILNCIINVILKDTNKNPLFMKILFKLIIFLQDSKKGVKENIWLNHILSSAEWYPINEFRPL